jgi:hypothetical protein
MKRTKKSLPAKERDQLLKTLEERFEKNMHRHKGVDWAKVRARLERDEEKLWSLSEMERTGGEPDVARLDGKGGDITFVDCSPETPKGRRSICYDREALNARKEHKPATSAVDMANEMGIELLTEEEYFKLQEVGAFDTKTSSWLETPPEIRKLGGAIFGDRRYNRVFIYHNGADSYYAARGFRGVLRL